MIFKLQPTCLRSVLKGGTNYGPSKGSTRFVNTQHYVRQYAGAQHTVRMTLHLISQGLRLSLDALRLLVKSRVPVNPRVFRAPRIADRRRVATVVARCLQQQRVGELLGGGRVLM